ncbi:fumarylacetoacetate hydrolase family protein [Streptomyces sp. NPDC001642]|uniref:fumarylacetoacetate hydrolase family protein n=1 Tax=Streptomyces sp. NPDC001642 TaxID=3154392 RepID=UPI00332C9D35
MKWCTHRSEDGGTRPGLVIDDHIRLLPGDRQLIDLLGVPDGLAAAANLAVSDPHEIVPLDPRHLFAPIPTPPSVRDFMAFEEHVVTSSAALGLEVDPDWYEIPVFYFSNPAAVHGPEADVRISPGSSMFDYELEIAAVVGTGGSDLHPDKAADHIAGYMLLCDWSARDLQAREMRQSLGPAKGKDSATSFGPFLVTPDELADRASGNAYDIGMRAYRNGELYSSGNLADLYWSFGQMLAYASRGTRLVPGDVIGSGTVGTGCVLELSRVHGVEEFPFLEPGDTVRLEADRLGAIESTMLLADEPIPLRTV